MSSTTQNNLKWYSPSAPRNSSICGKQFTQLPSLNKHMRVHTGMKPYVCDFAGCKKAFSQVNWLVKIEF